MCAVTLEFCRRVVQDCVKLNTFDGGHRVGTWLSGEFLKWVRSMNSSFLLMQTANNYLMELHVVLCSNLAEKNPLNSGCTSEVLSLLSKERPPFSVYLFFHYHVTNIGNLFASMFSIHNTFISITTSLALKISFFSL